ncbi:MAG: ABC transporter permease [Burkholderiaceae bacterium]|nr:MAG: ABC transporter permease [Burkholderiaceae bacterium]
MSQWKTLMIRELKYPDFRSRLTLSIILLWVSSLCALPARAQSGNVGCGSLANAYGPYDFRTDLDKLPIVLSNHFTPEVEALVSGKTGPLGADIDYTLRAIPNEPRALIAMMRLGEKEKTPQPRGSRYPIECWFDRAIRFRPDDVIVRMIYSTYLNKQGRIADANKELAIATNYAKDNAFTHYNIGLHYFDLKNYDQALIEAHKAIALGFQRTELRDKLKSVGKWVEPDNKAVGAASPAIGAASAPQR